LIKGDPGAESVYHWTPEECPAARSRPHVGRSEEGIRGGIRSTPSYRAGICRGCGAG
jgi:hypothetical protein